MFEPKWHQREQARTDAPWTPIPEKNRPENMVHILAEAKVIRALGEPVRAFDREQA